MIKTKGISLIVLVITIIVMIIIAGAIILSLSNANVIDKAKEAKNKTNLSVLKERWNSAYQEALVQNGGTTPTLDQITTNVGTLPSSDYSTTITGIKYSGTDTAVISAATALGIELPPSGPVIPNGFIASTVVGETTVDQGLVIKEGTDGASTTSNEFVWIPVTDISQFYMVGNFSTFDVNANASYKTMIGAPYGTEGPLMYASVLKYKGFYIGRYEAGNESSTFVSKKSTTPYYTTTFANYLIKARAYKPVASATSDGMPVSTLVYEEQWDAAMRFMKDVTNTGTPSSKYIINSAAMGNYFGSRVLTGTNSAYMVKNIYDMAGNMREWVMGEYSTSWYTTRGGYYSSNGSDSPVSNRDYSSTTATDASLGTRMAIYLK